MKENLVTSDSRKSIRYRSPKCLNCGNPLELSDRYCSYCGQLNTTKRLSLSDYFSEFISSIFTYDSRFRYTIKDLLFKPGTITRNYTQGKRIMYANPFRFFLSVSIIYFLMNSLFNYFEEDDSIVYNENGSISEISKAFSQAKNDALFTVDSIQDENKKLEEEKTEYEYIAEKDIDTLNRLARITKKYNLFSDFYEVTKIESPSKALDSLKYEHSLVNRWIYERKQVVDRIDKNPLKFIYFLANKIPFFLFFFAPIFSLFLLLIYFKWYSFKEIETKVENSSNKTVVYLTQKIPIVAFVLKYLLIIFMWLFYVKRKINYMEHVVFIFHIFTFVFVLLLICIIPDYYIGDSLCTSISLVLIGPFYFYKALRNFYKENRFLTIFKFFVLNIVFLILGLITGILFAIITAVTY